MKNFLLLLSLIAFMGGCTSKQPTEQQLLAKAKKIHSSIITIDSHTDTPMWFMREGFNFVDGGENTRAKVTLNKMQEGGLDAAFFAVFLGQDERTPEKNERAYVDALEILDSIHSIVNRNGNTASIALNSDDAKRLKKEGKRAIYIGVENGYPIGTDLDKINALYDRGARYMTLCHTANNDICDSSTDNPEHNGLSEFGEEVIVRLNEVGMMIDVSHISDSSFYQTLRITKVPVIASHSDARAICDHPRNLTDDMLLVLKENGGVIQMCILSGYVKPDEPYPARDSAMRAMWSKYGSYRDLDAETRKLAMAEWYAIDAEYPPILATVADMVDHIDHIVQLIGVDYIGIGSDFDGGGALKDCYDAGEMHNITVELLRRGYSKTDIKKIWGENFLRVFREVEEFAQKQS